MPVQLGEYHPFAACLMFKGSGDAGVVRVNLQMITSQWFAMGKREGQHDHG